jgi:hypothetical protein
MRVELNIFARKAEVKNNEYIRWIYQEAQTKIN